MSYFPNPGMDPYKEATDGPTEDPWGYSRLDRMDGLGVPLPEYIAAARQVAPLPVMQPKRTFRPWRAAGVLLAVFAGFAVVGGVVDFTITGSVL